MNQNLSRPADSRLKPTSQAEAFCADLLVGTRWVAGNLNGVPSPRMEDELDFGILPEPYHAAARGADYAVFHFETPIVWRNAEGVWQVPDHFFSTTTSKLRNKIVEALGLNGETVEII